MRGESVLLTDVDGDLLEEEKAVVSKHEYKKFREIYQMHKAAPRSKLYLADGYNLVRYYTSGMNICEKQENKERNSHLICASGYKEIESDRSTGI